MAYLISESTQQVLFTPDVALDSLSVVVTADDGSTVAVGQPTAPVAPSRSWTLTLQSTLLPAALVGHTLVFAWTLTAGSQVRVVSERIVVLDTVGRGLCTVAQVKSRLGLTSTAQDGRIDGMIAVVTPVFNARYGREFMPRSTATRNFDLRSRIVAIGDLATPTTVTLHPDTPDQLVLTQGTDYVLRMDDMTGTAISLRLSEYLPITSDRFARFGTAQLRITGEWGIWGDVTEVSPDVCECAVDTVASWMDRGSSNIAGIDNSDVRGVGVAAGVTWDIPFAVHVKMKMWSNTMGVW